MHDTQLVMRGGGGGNRRKSILNRTKVQDDATQRKRTSTAYCRLRVEARKEKMVLSDGLPWPLSTSHPVRELPPVLNALRLTLLGCPGLHRVASRSIMSPILFIKSHLPPWFFIRFRRRPTPDTNSNKKIKWRV